MSNVSPFSTRDVGGFADKVDFINDAYSQLRISGLTVQPTPEDLEVALMRLENMAAEWAARLDVGYNFEETPDPNSTSNIKRAFWHCFATNLAIRLIPDFNKPVPPTLERQAAQAYSYMSGAAAIGRLQQVDYPNRQPQGSGNTLKYNRWQRFYRTDFSDLNSVNVVRMFQDDINDYVEHYDAYLDEGETIASYSIVADNGLNIVSDSNTDDDVDYRVQANASSADTSSALRQVTIIVTTSNGRRETRYRLFEIYPVDN